MNKQEVYTKETVLSKDGTIIGYRQLGKGPGIVLIHGGLKSSQDFMKLAVILSRNFTVYVVDRRGRGFSGSVGDNFSVIREVEDIQALVTKTGAQNIFALSAGALVALRAALSMPSLKRIGLYEPPFSVHGSTPAAWVSRYTKEVAQGHLASACVTGMKGLAIVHIFTLIPRFILRPGLALVMMLQGKSKPDEVTIRSLVPTWRYDMQIVDEMKDTLDQYTKLDAQVMLMGGTKSPAWLNVSLDALEKTLPNTKRVILPGLGHDGPEDDGDPEVVAKELLTFFAEQPNK